MSNAHFAFALLTLLVVPVVGRVRDALVRRRQFRQMMQRYGHKLLMTSVEPPRPGPVEPAQY